MFFQAISFFLRENVLNTEVCLGNLKVDFFDLGCIIEIFLSEGLLVSILLDRNYSSRYLTLLINPFSLNVDSTELYLLISTI